MSKASIGMIGVGLMGHGIASNLLKHGWPLTVLEHPGNQPLDALRAGGVRTCGSIRELSAGSDVIILVVNGSAQVEPIVLGDDGVLAGLRPGTVVIDCSTAIPASTEKVAAQVVAKGGRFLDAPMTRTPNEAAQGRLNLLVGGDAALLEECRPILSCFAENIVHAGPVAAGHRMKLLHNFVSLGSVTLLAEAAACAQRMGIASSTLVDVLAMGGGWGAALERLKPYLASADPSGLRFSMGNAYKDLSYYNEMARESGAMQAVAEGVKSCIEFGQANSSAQTLLPELVSVLGRTSPQQAN